MNSIQSNKFIQQTHKDFIGTYPGVVPEDLCNEGINIIENEISHNRFLTRKSQTQGDSHIIADKSLALDIYRNEQHLNYSLKLKSYLRECLNIYQDKYPSVKRTLADPKNQYSYIDEYKLQKTELREGYHIWHHELHNSENMSRFLTYTIYLNDVKEGGETEFLDQSIRIPATKGTICLFPPYYTHTHRGNPPISNTKYIVTGWFVFFTNPFFNPSLLLNE